ncbi:MAG TPA: ABC transporter permease [Thermoclostridium sp.]|nr:ABC transporter permease [Thermoclostridium sp.]
MKKNRTKLPNIFLGIVTVIMYLPIVVVIIYSFNESRISSVWEGFSLKWYGELFRDRYILDALTNSIVLATLSSLSAAIIGTLGAVGMTRVKLRSNSVIEYVSTLPIMIPEIILGIVFLLFFSLMGMPFGMLTLVIAHTAFCIPYVFIMVKARLAGMDKSLSEAARDLGANEWRAFLDIILPLISPAIASGMIISFAMSFDDVVISMFVTGVNTNTLPLRIYTQLKTGVTPKINALCTLMVLFTILLCLLSAYIGKTYNKNRLEERQSV